MSPQWKDSLSAEGRQDAWCTLGCSVLCWQERPSEGHRESKRFLGNRFLFSFPSREKTQAAYLFGQRNCYTTIQRIIWPGIRCAAWCRHGRERVEDSFHGQIWLGLDHRSYEDQCFSNGLSWSLACALRRIPRTNNLCAHERGWMRWATCTSGLRFVPRNSTPLLLVS